MCTNCKRPKAAVMAFQRREHLDADGVVGKATWKHLDIQVSGKVHYAKPGLSRKKLLAHQRNAEWQVPTHCFAYAWLMVRLAGGKSIGAARQSHDGRWKPTSYIDTLVQQGKIKVGDIVYVNRKPGADPSSTNLAYGPHWFVYVGNGQWADQYGIKASGGAMAAFVPGRYVDTIYHTS